MHHRQLQETYGLVNNREMPEWGARIFSPMCVLVRPSSPEDMAKFVKYAIAVSRVTYELSLLATPVPSDEYVVNVVNVVNMHNHAQCDTMQCTAYACSSSLAP